MRRPDNARNGRDSKLFTRDFGVPPTPRIPFYGSHEPDHENVAHQCFMTVATGLTNCAAESAELLTLLDSTYTTPGHHRAEVLADEGLSRR